MTNLMKMQVSVSACTKNVSIDIRLVLKKVVWLIYNLAMITILSCYTANSLLPGKVTIFVGIYIVYANRYVAMLPAS